MSKMTKALVATGLLAMVSTPMVAGAEDNRAAGRSPGTNTPGTTTVGGGVGTGRGSHHALNGLRIAEERSASSTPGELVRRHCQSN